jgi:nucleoside-diphosphate-sugar epimerase
VARILVTGGAGFIGSHLCERLVSGPNEVICLDDYSIGSRANIEHLEGRPNFFPKRHDITKPLSLAGDVDQIYHLASPASPDHFEAKPVETALPNSVGTWLLLEMARAKRSRLLFASTSEVYGDPLQHPQNEDYRGNVSVTGPRAPYDESKRFGEALCLAYMRQFDVDIAIARIFNTYGPRMANDGRVVPALVLQALRGEPMTVHGDGKQTRSFCYVSDLVDGLIALMKSGEPGPVNLGSPVENTVLEVAQKVKAVTGSKSDVAFHPARPDDPVRRQPDIRRAQQLLHWKPQVSLDDGLRQTVAYFKARAK